MSRPKKPKLPLPPPLKTWAVYSAKGYLYAASNHYSKALATSRHCSDFGITWKEARKQGDRLIRVKITPSREV